MSWDGTILVTDSDPSVTLFLSEALIDAGYAVLSSVGQPTLTMIERVRPRLLLLDLQRENMESTLGLLDQLRELSDTRAVAVLVCSTDPSLLRDLSARLEHLKCTSLPKPCELDQLYACVASTLHTECYV